MSIVKPLRYVRVNGNTTGFSELRAGEQIAFSDVEAHTHEGVYQPLDLVYVLTKTFTLTTDWTYVGIHGTDLQTGTYAIQVYANDATNGGTNVDEYYSGTMSWYAGNTDSVESDEIALHRAGASTDGNIYLRTHRTLSDDTRDLILEVRSNIPTLSPNNYVFKFRKLI